MREDNQLMLHKVDDNLGRGDGEECVTSFWVIPIRFFLISTSAQKNKVTAPLRAIFIPVFLSPVK